MCHQTQLFLLILILNHIRQGVRLHRIIAQTPVQNAIPSLAESDKFKSFISQKSNNRYTVLHTKIFYKAYIHISVKI